MKILETYVIAENYIEDLNLPFSCYSEVTVKRECGYFKEINK